MADRLKPEERSALMAKVRGKDSVIEVKVRSALHKRGFRFRKNVKGLPGSPDIVLPKYKAVIFVHGCFWHGHEGCRKSRLPTTRRLFWEEKRKANLERDARKKAELRMLGWRVAIVWQCSLENESQTLKKVDNLVLWIRSGKNTCEI